MSSMSHDVRLHNDGGGNCALGDGDGGHRESGESGRSRRRAVSPNMAAEPEVTIPEVEVEEEVDWGDPAEDQGGEPPVVTDSDASTAVVHAPTAAVDDRDAGERGFWLEPMPKRRFRRAMARPRSSKRDDRAPCP